MRHESRGGIPTAPGHAERMYVRLLSFLCCATALVLVEGSVLRAEDQVVQCGETKVKGAIELALACSNSCSLF